MKRIVMMFLLVIPYYSSAFATVDMLCFNTCTKDLHIFSAEDDSIGICWECIGEGDERYMREEKRLIDAGYTYTQFPFKIEVALLLFIVLPVIVFVVEKIKGAFFS